MNNIKWPKTMPILNGNDMYHGELHSCCGKRHCLLGHSFVVGAKTNSDVENSILKAIRNAITEVVGTVDMMIYTFNDTHSLRTNAQIWNRAMYLLGYTEGNPQSKPVVIKKATK